MRTHKEAQDEFYQSKKEDEDELESKRPAYFRKEAPLISKSDAALLSDSKSELSLTVKEEEYKAYLNLQK